jgi:hypothetical protein
MVSKVIKKGLLENGERSHFTPKNLPVGVPRRFIASRQVFD